MKTGLDSGGVFENKLTCKLEFPNVDSVLLAFNTNFK
jgi:hypothetical protein